MDTNSNKELLQGSKKLLQDNQTCKRKYLDNNTDPNKEHPQVNKISKKKYQYEDINLNDESPQINKASKKGQEDKVKQELKFIAIG
ncbi:hypothetical protein F8M41_015307 [Gigaspora margarita]|uniref:Uncharacterized protein n=1 Tax=Gigaspora margarita TaxID=4874 RepID=A0A8H3ZWL1_GIGMA|nr:hypothetical protein F8M41_015307 [Gigaspora margarita]